jgi:hypothetical protein
VRSPLRDEGAAFRLVFVTLGAFGLIAITSAISTWLGVAVTVVLASVGSGYVWQSRQAATRRAASEFRAIVVGSQPNGKALSAELGRLAGDRPVATRVVELGGSDPVRAVEDALQGFAAEAIVVSGPGDDDVAERLRQRFVIPVTRVPSG